MRNKVTEVIETAYKTLKVVGIQIIQIQIEQDSQDAYIYLSRNEARELARVILEHCDEADKQNALVIN